MRRTLLLLILCLTLHLASGEQWHAGTEVTAEELASYDIDKLFVSEPISDAIFSDFIPILLNVSIFILSS